MDTGKFGMLFMAAEQIDKEKGKQGVDHLFFISFLLAAFRVSLVDQIRKHRIFSSVKKKIRDFRSLIKGSLKEIGEYGVAIQKSEKRLFKSTFSDKDIHDDIVIMKST